MNKRRMFLNVFATLLVFIFISLYLAEGAIFVFVNQMISDITASHVVVTDRAILAWTTVYVALCGLALPTPAELPLAFSERVSLAMIILASAISKSIGATILFIVCTSGLKFGNHDAYVMQKTLRNGWVGRLFHGDRLGFIYALCQAIPFAPMRSATVAYSIVSPLTLKTVAIVAVGSFFGTVSRMLIFAGLALAGFSLLTQTGVLR
ncbi:hypothetical protein [Tateyamaria sp. syn59]|uniref:hypothetical protein n=1 Tax=Tateyamaria sp. syn59 TaxID=2576942 RepID=UPI0011BE71B7|nr:hypothetical protein [Tateyamaria sp. syn59]